MLDLKKYEKLFDVFVFNNEISTRDLLRYGFSKYDLELLVKNGTIVRERVGVYSYAGDLDTCLELFLKRLEANNISGVLKCIEVLESKYSDKVDYKLWLYMLGCVNKLPDKYRNMIFDVNYSKYEFDDRGDSYKEFRDRIYKGQFYLAGVQANGLLGDSIEDKITSILLDEILEIEKENYDKTMTLIRSKNYDELYKMYEILASQRPLSFSERGVYLLTGDLVSDEELRERQGPSRNIVDLIYLRRYAQALNDFRKENRRASNRMYPLVLVAADRVKIENSKFEDIIEAVTNGEVGNILERVRLYLTKIGCSNYVQYVNDLVLLGDLDGDELFSDAMVDLSLICNGRFEFDATRFIQDFYIALYNKDFKRAKICLDIVSHSRTFNGPKIDVTKMNYTYSREFRNFKKLSKMKNIDLEEEYIDFDSIIEDVSTNKGIRLLSDVSDEERNRLKKILEEKRAKIALENLEGTLVLRYFNQKKEFINYPVVMRDANVAFSTENFSEAIRLFNVITENVLEVWPSTYKKIGLAYLRGATTEEDYKNAYRYLWVAKVKGESVDKMLDKVVEHTDYKSEALQYIKK